jgi:hypothetical protein
MSDHPRINSDALCVKRGYVTKRAARNANRTNGHRLRPYWCPHCRAWHVTKQVRVIRRGRRLEPVDRRYWDGEDSSHGSGLGAAA